MLVPNIKKRIFIFAPIFPLMAVFPMLFIEDFGYWSWYLQVITWWIGFTVAIAFSLTKNDKKTELTNNSSRPPQAAAES